MFMQELLQRKKWKLPAFRKQFACGHGTRANEQEHTCMKSDPARRRREDFQPWTLEQSGGSIRGRAERTQQQSDTKTQLDRYNHLFVCALTQSSPKSHSMSVAENPSGKIAL